MKRILFILHYPPPVHGSSVMGQIVKESKPINETFSCAYINLSTSRTLDEVGERTFKKVGRYLSIITKVIKQLLTNRPQLCYIAIAVKGAAFKKDAFIAFIVKLFGVKIIYHFHNKGISTNQHKIIDNILYKCVFKNTRGILLSEYLYDDIKKYFSKERIYICPNGISDFHATKEDQNENIKSPNPPINAPIEILFLSNLIKSKGVFILLEACKILHQKGFPFKCTFVGAEGNISKEDFQQKVEELNLSEQVEYVGKKYGSDKEEAYAKSDIFVFPTYYNLETFGLVNLEAMQHSLPVISTPEGGIPDVVEDGKTGYLVPQKNVKALAEKLAYLILNPQLREKMGKAGREKYEKEFTLEIFENKLLSIFRHVIDKV